MTTKLVLTHIAAGVAGMAIGAVGAYFFLQEKFNRELNAELENIRKARIKSLSKAKEGVSDPDKEVYDRIAEYYLNGGGKKPSTGAIEAPRIDSDPNLDKVHTEDEEPITEAAVDSLMGSQESPPEDEAYFYEDDPYTGPEIYSEEEMMHVPDSTSKYCPYIISEEEFSMTQLGYTKATITYFAGDDTLADEDESIMNFEVVGEENLGCFNASTNIMYVRNDSLGIDFEIVKNEGMYSRDVLGIDPEESYPKRGK